MEKLLHPCKTVEWNYSSMPWIQWQFNLTTIEVWVLVIQSHVKQWVPLHINVLFTFNTEYNSYLYNLDANINHPLYLHIGAFCKPIAHNKKFPSGHFPHLQGYHGFSVVFVINHLIKQTHCSIAEWHIMTYEVNILFCFALYCFIYTMIHIRYTWLLCPYLLELLIHWLWGNDIIAQMQVK